VSRFWDTPEDFFDDHLEGKEIMSRQAVIREKHVSHKGITLKSDANGTVTVTTREKGELQFTEAEFLSLVESSQNILEWKSAKDE
jgi:hypothetical protein